MTIRLEPPISASMEACIAEHVAAPIPPANYAYDQAPLVESSTAAAARPPRGQYDFVDTIEAGQGLIHSPGHDAQTIAKVANRAEDVGYLRRTAYEIELHEVRQGYLSSEAQNRVLLARLETLETHMSRMEWQRQSTEDLAVRQMMRTQVLEARARIDMIEKIESVFHISGCAVENQVKFATCTLLGVALTWWNGHVRGNDVAAYTQRFQELALMCTKFLADETAKIDKYIGGLPDNIHGNVITLGHDAAYAMTWGTFKNKLTDKYCPNSEIKKLEIELWNLKIDKYIGGLPDNIHGNVMSARPKTLDFAIELSNDLMDQKLRTYAERQNENKRKADDSSRNNHQQQPHKK
ncbi:hypothetical protein Tco_1348943 [Tanacetum coccineum]